MILFFFTFFIIVFPVYRILSKLEETDTISRWREDLKHGPKYFSNHIETHLEIWNANLLDELKEMRRKQWISKEEFRAMRKQLSCRYDLIKASEPVDTSGSKHVQGGRS